MKSVVLAVALTGLISVTALGGEIPTNDVVAPASDCATSTSSSVALAQVVLTIVTLTTR
jgi:hypothetical protein